MSYIINYSEAAKRDLRSIYAYIAFELHVQETAQKLCSRIMEAVESLSEMPGRNARYQDDPWNGLGLRWTPVDNYLIFYFIDDSSDTVNIVRIMYKGRDISKQL